MLKSKIILSMCLMFLIFNAAHAQSRALVKASVFSGGIITTVAGDGYDDGSGFGRFTGDGGPATQASFNRPWGLDIDSSGNLYISDRNNNRIRKVDAATGIITTVAGSGNPVSSGDGGSATQAGFSSSWSVSLDTSGNIYFDDRGRFIRRVDTQTQIITTVAGNGEAGFSGDGGPATLASLNGVIDVFIDASGNIFIADTNNNRIRKVDAATGIITTVAGNGETGFSGDGQPATLASLNLPRGIYVDASGNIFIADTNNNRIRKVDAATGIITTVAGNGEAGFSGDGQPATEAKLRGPHDVSMDVSGNLYISDWQNSRIRKVDAKTSLITTIAGGGNLDTGDGNPALLATVYAPRRVVIGPQGNLYIMETAASRQRVRKVTPEKPASGMRFEMAQSIAGLPLEFNWTGTINESGLVELTLEKNTGRVSGYYIVRVVDMTSGNVVAQWGSIPINSGQELSFDLKFGLDAFIHSVRPLPKPTTILLDPNHPNPFNPSTTIAYQLPEAGDVSLVIYSALGQQVRTLVSGFQSAGQYRVVWDGKDALGRSASSGVYIYRLISNDQVQTRRMLLLK